MKKKSIIIIVVLLVLTAGGYFVLTRNDNEPRFRTEKAVRGSIRAAVTANGTVNAVTTVLVGTQVSGTIKNLYVDYNTPVKKGQLLALIDPATFEAQEAQARANLAAGFADLEKAEAALLDSRRTLERNRTLFARNLIPRSDLDTAETAHTSAAAQVSAAKARIEQLKAALRTAEINLKYTRILSPVDGTVISRNVDVGQTVAASFQTPTLFNIAQDLTRMQIDTSVAEADIGRIETGQPVEFTVDAYPERIFKGKVSEIRNAPITVQNVVTYDVVVRVDNPDYKLKPGMTANVSIITAEKADVLKIPNTALRFKMPVSEKTAESGKPEVKPAGARGTGTAKVSRGFGIWTLDAQGPKRVRIVTGISDGIFTEVVSGDLKEGRDVIVESLMKPDKKSGSQPRPPGMFR